MKIATFNINSVRARIVGFVDWLREEQPDVVLLQEIKCQEDTFPFADLSFIGYDCKMFGQKSYNGVAIISKFSIEDVVIGLPTFPEDIANARYIEALIDGRIRVASIYAPNGNPIDDGVKFPYKIKWHKKLNEHIQTLMTYDEPVILGGDFNVAVSDREVYNPKSFKDDAITQPESRAEFKAMIDAGLTDAFRTFHPDEEKAYTYWGYRAQCFQKDFGILLDYFLLNKQAMALLKDSYIDKKPRQQEEKPSDHTALCIELK